jgi:MFS family permease
MASSTSLQRIFSSFQHPNYRLWFGGQLISLVGTWMQSTAQGYLIYTLTGSTAYLGYISIAAGIPTWIFMLYGGVIADRIPRRKLIMITQAAMMVLALALAALVFTNTIQPWHILVLAFLLGIANAFDAPTRQSFVLELVGREDMTNAIALNGAMFNLGIIIGPSIAGVTYAAVGPAWCFLINGISFIAVIVALSLMKISYVPEKLPARNVMEDLRTGIQYVAQNRAVRSLITNLGLMSIFGFGVVALIPAWAVEVLHGDVRVNGLLLTARGVGSVIATLWIASRGNRRGRGKIWQLGNLLLPVFWIIFSFISNLPLALAAIGVVGMSFILCNNLSNSIVQTAVPDALRGRVMAIYTMVFFGLTPVGSLLAGLAAEKFSLQTTVLASGSIFLVIALFTFIRYPYLRRLD